MKMKLFYAKCHFFWLCIMRNTFNFHTYMMIYPVSKKLLFFQKKCRGKLSSAIPWGEKRQLFSVYFPYFSTENSWNSRNQSSGNKKKVWGHVYINKLVGWGGYEVCLINLYNNMADSDIQPGILVPRQCHYQVIVQGLRKTDFNFCHKLYIYYNFMGTTMFALLKI